MFEQKISVIIPVYNASKYLARCVDSVLAQTYDNIEVILVNDGSTDGSDSICDKYAADFADKVTVIHQANEGVSVARNAGISYATGSMISFVDADDWLAIDMLEKLYRALVEKNAQISICGYFSVSDSDIIAKKAFPKPATSVRDILKQNCPAFSWGKLYTSTLFQFLKYPEGISLGEDTAMLLPLYSHVDSFVYVDQPLYYYYQHTGSATQNVYDAAKMYSYLKGCHLAMENAADTYKDEIAYSVADRIVSNENWFLKSCLAEAIEYVSQNMMDYFVKNSYILKDKRLSAILNYPSRKLIPNIAYYDNFSGEQSNEVSETCFASWKKNAPLMEIIELNATNCDISAAPTSVKTEYENKNFAVVGQYFKLKKIYETGGLALSKDIYFSTSVGSIRTEKSFFALRNRFDFQSSIFGAQQNSQVIAALLATYDDDGPYQDGAVDLCVRIREVLVEQFGYTSAGWTVRINDSNITVFKCNILSYDITHDNVAFILDNVRLQLLGSEYIVLEKKAMQYWEDDKNLFWADREALKKKLASGQSAGSTAKNSVGDNETALRAELDSMLNSRSWRITAPLRKIAAFFRKGKKSRR